MEIPFQAFVRPKNINSEFRQNLSINKYYLSLRNTIFNILYKISNEFRFKKQTYFLATYFLDIIFSNNKKLKENIYISALSCLCLSAKFCENDTKVPHLIDFTKSYNKVIDCKDKISIKDLRKNEIFVCKLLNYKLNHYTIYDYNIFFFSNGILEIEQLKNLQIINEINSSMVQNILNKIYKKSSYYLDNGLKLYEICIKYNPLFISILIMKKSLEVILKEELNIKNEEDFHKNIDLYFKKLMNDYYQIDYEINEQYKQLINEPEVHKIFFEKNNNKINKINENEIRKQLIKENILIKKQNFPKNINNNKLPTKRFDKKIIIKDNTNNKSHDLENNTLFKKFPHSARGIKKDFSFKKHNNSINIVNINYNLSHRKKILMNQYNNNKLCNSKNKNKRININNKKNSIENYKLNGHEFIQRNENNKNNIKMKSNKSKEVLPRTFLNKIEANLNKSNNHSIRKKKSPSISLYNQCKSKVNSNILVEIKKGINNSKSKNNSKKKDINNLHINILKPKISHKIFESNSFITPIEKKSKNSNNHQYMKENIEYKNKDNKNQINDKSPEKSKNIFTKKTNKIYDLKSNKKVKQKDIFEYLLSQKETEINKTFSEINKERRDNKFLGSNKNNKIENIVNSLNSNKLSKFENINNDIHKLKSQKKCMNKANNNDSQNNSTIIINNIYKLNLYKNNKTRNIPKLNISNINDNSSRNNKVNSKSSTKRSINKVGYNTSRSCISNNIFNNLLEVSLNKTKI